MKETLIQFGEGNFLRGFVEHFLQMMNDSGVYDGKAVIVQPRDSNKVEGLMKQNCKYNLVLEGMENGNSVQKTVQITCVSRAIDPYKNFDSYLELAQLKDARIIVSNTTEAGIVFDDKCKLDDKPCTSFPGKLTQLLYERYKKALPGFIILPCELIDNNADELKSCVLKYARLWGLQNEFISWVENENRFCNTLVDRIVSGFSAEKASEIYEKTNRYDSYLVTAEPFHLWVIEGDFESELPLKKGGVNVVWTDDVSLYKTRKVRLLNGAHTSIVFTGLLMGCQTVKECTENDTMNAFLRKCLLQQLLPSLQENEENKEFALSVLERFSNPYIKHKLKSISLASISKFKARVLPGIVSYKEKFAVLPDALILSLASLIYYYKNHQPDDDSSIVDTIKSSELDDILKNTELWGVDLSFALSQTAVCYDKICKDGIEETVKWIL